MSHPVSVASAPDHESGSGRVSRGHAFDVALQWFLDGRRIDMSALARDLAVGRSTLYRWFTSREALLGDISWRIMADTIGRIEARDRGDGSSRERFLRVYGRLTEAVRGFPPLMTFLADDPDYALRVLTSSYGTVQGALIDWVSSQLDGMAELPGAVDTDDLAYAIVRLGESFLWSDMITGSAPRADKAIAMIELLLAGACAGHQPAGGEEGKGSRR
jgi:AcrR family transcriptional regulator